MSMAVVGVDVARKPIRKVFEGRGDGEVAKLRAEIELARDLPTSVCRAGLQAIPHVVQVLT